MEWRGSNPNVATPEYSSLAERLDAITRNVDDLIGPARMEPSRRAVAELIQSKVAALALAAGEKSPNFELPDAQGRNFILGDRLAQGPVVLVFFRGRWCPYCIAQLEELEKARPLFEQAGATLVAVSPQKPQHTGFTAEQHHLRFPVLSDKDNTVARQYGIAWKLPSYLVSHYRGVFVNLEHANANKDWELPVPATFVIAPDATIVWVRTDPDFRRRPEPQEVLRVVKMLKGF